MAWSNKAVSERRKRLPRNWHQLRRQRLELDGYRCVAIRADTGERCEARATDVDHLIEMEDDHRLEALQSLCSHHHDAKTALAGGLAGAAKRKKPQPRHPGIIP